MRKLVSLIMVLALSTPIFSALAQDTRAPLRNSDIISLVEAKLPESTIILSIQTRPSDFDTSPEALVKLKESGVPTKVIEAMLQASVKPAPTGAPAAPSPREGYWGSKQSRIEVDRVFLLEGDKRTEMKITTASTRGFFYFVTQVFAVLPGAKARLRSNNRSPEFELILPNNVDASSVVALGLLAERDNGTREILIGGGFVSIDQRLPAERNMHLNYEKVTDQSAAPEGYEIYRIKPAEPLRRGEYAFMMSKASGAGPMGGASNYNFYDLGVD